VDLELVAVNWGMIVYKAQYNIIIICVLITTSQSSHLSIFNRVNSLVARMHLYYSRSFALSVVCLSPCIVSLNITCLQVVWYKIDNRQESNEAYVRIASDML
jgi:hypothetical protein